MTPLIKTYAAETAWPMVGQAIQVYGGVGYTEEYPVSQYARDVKILSIWEGTSFIHSMDLVGRKMRMGGGKPFDGWLEDRRQFIDQYKNTIGFSGEMAKLEKACSCVEEIRDLYNSYYGEMAGKGHSIPLYATKVLTCCAQLFAAEALLDQALVARDKIAGLGAGHHDYKFYSGKIAAARYFANNILPNVYMLTELIKSDDRSALDCPEEAFLVE